MIIAKAIRSIRILSLLFILINSSILIGQNVHLENDTIKISSANFYNHSFSLNLPDLLFKRIVLNYTTIIERNTYYDFSLGFHYSGPVVVGGSFGLYDLIEQTSLNYNSIMIRAGLKRYYYSRFLLGFLINYKFDFNNNMRFVNDDIYANRLSSKYKNHIGFVCKFGVVLIKSKYILSEIYLGLGIRKTYAKETVKGYYNMDSKGTQYLYEPMIITVNEIEPTFHFGITVGLRL
jgi:hypothetical protein